MIIVGFIWFTDIIDKLENKHGVAMSEVESVFVEIPVFNRIGRGHVRGELILEKDRKLGALGVLR